MVQNMQGQIKKIKILTKIRFIFCIFQFVPFFKFLRDKFGQKKQKLINELLDEICTRAGLKNKYKEHPSLILNPIGNKVWMFWYTGFDTAPPIVKKCVTIVKQLDEVDLILLDKDNLEKYFTFEGNIRKFFYDGKISIQTFSDILRCQLLSRYGGFWFDATLFVINKDFIVQNKNLPYWSMKHSNNNLLLKKKMNEYFTEGRWTNHASGSGKNNPLFSFIYEMFLLYYQNYDYIFDYFQIDYIWLYAYDNFNWAKKLVDDVTPSVSCSYYLGQHLTKKFDYKKWEEILHNNSFQKLRWKVKSNTKTKKHLTYYDYFINYYDS